MASSRINFHDAAATACVSAIGCAARGGVHPTHDVSARLYRIDRCLQASENHSRLPRYAATAWTCASVRPCAIGSMMAELSGFAGS